MATDIDIAWAAGLFEGEGCFSSYDKRGPDERKRLGILATVTMADLDVLERFQAIVGVGSIYKLKTDKRFPGHRPLWKWIVQSRGDVEVVGELLRPWLCERRRARLDEVLAVRTVNEPRACTYCGSEFVPQRARGERAFCSQICKARSHFNVKSPRYGNPPIQEVQHG